MLLGISPQLILFFQGAKSNRKIITRSPSSALSHPFLGAASPTKMDETETSRYQRILISPLEDLVEFSTLFVFL